MTRLPEPMAGCDLQDLVEFAAASQELLAALDADRVALRALVEAATTDHDLLALCEHYDILDKLVLHNDPTGWRLRLHVFAAGYFDRPHNHRWSYTSRILHGSYTHTLYGVDDQLDDRRAKVDVAELVPRLVRTEHPGQSYTMHHSTIHAVTAAPNTTSLIVRGPAVKARFLVTDRTTGQSWWQTGAADEPPEQAARKRMTSAQVDAVAADLITRGVLSQ